MAAPANSQLGAVVLRGALIEAILLILGAAVTLNTGNVLWLIGAGMLGAVVMVLLVVQSGALKATDDRR